MSLPRFHAERLSHGAVLLDEAESRHALASLRLRPGDQAELIDGRGGRAVGILQPPEPTDKRAARRQAVFLVQNIQRDPPIAPPLTLIVAACKGPRLAWMVEKLTEFGVSRVILAEFERSVVRTAAGHADKLRRTALEACKQSGGLWLPEIIAGVALADVIALPAVAPEPRNGGSPRLLIAHPDLKAQAAVDEIRVCIAGQRAVQVVIGPEGGLTEDEVARLVAAGGCPIRLAPQILRIETAAMAVAALWAGQIRSR